MQAPDVVVIGTPNLKLEVFDDSKPLEKAGGMVKINAIRVFYTDKYVRGFEIFYKLNAGDLLKAGHNVPTKKKELQSAVFEIGPDDYISEILGSYQTGKKNKIVNITFITYRGKAQSFGGVGDQSFKFCHPGYSFAAFRGGFKKQIEWLEIKTQPLPPQFKLEMEKLGIIRPAVDVRVVAPSGNGQHQPPVVVAKVQVMKPQIVAMPNLAAPMQQPVQAAPTYQPPQQPGYGQPGQGQPYQGQPAAQQGSGSLTQSKYPTFNSPALYPQYPGQAQPYNPYNK